MSVGYLEFWTGLGGDMLVGAFLDAGWDEASLRSVVDALELGPVEIRIERRLHHGLSGLGIQVTAPADPPHRAYPEVVRILERAALPDWVRKQSLETFRLLGEVEGRIHGVPLEKVHFHEIGSVDSLVDIVGSVLAVHELGLTELLAGPIPLSGGEVHMDHGRVPSPAPATSLLLEGWPVRPMEAEGEFLTPTAAALLRVLATPVPGMPPLEIERVGFGAGTRSHSQWPNLVRLWIGRRTGSPDKSEQEERGPLEGLQHRTVTLLETQIDDMDPRYMAALTEDLLEAGALDAFRSAVLMKKGRQGTLLTVVCDPAAAPVLLRRILTGSTTLGVRMRSEGRWELARRLESATTPHGQIRLKTTWGPNGPRRRIEYEDLVRVSRELGLPLDEVERRLETFLPPLSGGPGGPA